MSVWEILLLIFMAPVAFCAAIAFAALIVWMSIAVFGWFADLLSK